MAERLTSQSRFSEWPIPLNHQARHHRNVIFPLKLTGTLTPFLMQIQIRVGIVVGYSSSKKIEINKNIWLNCFCF